MNPVEVVVTEENIVPWMNKEEFKKAYQDLYSDNICEQRRGLEQVSVWRTGCKFLPFPIEITADIVSALLHHIILNNTEGFQNEIVVQLMYSGAIKRFVDLTLAKDKPANSEISLYDRAVKRNIPTWIIDLRNDAVFSYMPSLALFRLGAKFALNYLKETFWVEAVATQRQLIFPMDRLRKDILKLINEYKELQFTSIIEYLTKEESELLNQNLNAVLEKMHSYIDNYKETFLEILTEPGKFASFDDLDLLLNSKGSTFLEQPHLIIPYSLQEFWFPLLRELHNRDLLFEFLRHLLLAQGKTNCKTCHKLTIAWSIEIFEGVNSKSILTPLFRKKGILLDKIALAYCCTLRPNHYSKELLLRIFANSGDKKKVVVERFCFLVAMFLGEFVDQKELERESESIYDQRIFTMKDVEDYEKKFLKEENGAGDDRKSNWSLAPETIDFSKIPFGAILNPKNKEKEMDKLETSVVDDDSEECFIHGENVDPNDIPDEPDSPIFPEVVLPEDFDMVYRPTPRG